MEHFVQLLPSFKYMNQFKSTAYAPHPSLYTCVASSLVMAGEFAYPNRYNPDQQEEVIYTRFAGPDIVTNTTGMNREEAVKWLAEQHIGFIDMQPLIDSGNLEALHAQVGAQNKQGVLQLISLADESQMYEAVQDTNGNWVRGEKLHNWNDANLGHCFVRIGYNDSEPYGLYLDPASPGHCTDPKTGLFRPVKIRWEDILAGRPSGAIAIMKPGVVVPPEGLAFDWTSHTWPVVKPPFDAVKAESTVAAMITAMEAMKAAMGNLGADLGALKEEV